MNAKQPSMRTEILVTVLGILGAILFFTFYDQAFPAAALELKLTRQEIEQAARATLKEYGSG